jgi:hypothetical protein
MRSGQDESGLTVDGKQVGTAGRNNADDGELTHHTEHSLSGTHFSSTIPSPSSSSAFLILSATLSFSSISFFSNMAALPSPLQEEDVVGKLPATVDLLVWAFNNMLEGVTGEKEERGEVGALW